jgi:heme ABC exporter ATP-binding subunit CcmA
VSATSASPTPSGSSQAKSRSAIGVEFQDLGKRYGSLWALRRVSLRIAPGEFVLLRGPNGSGKSTLLKIAATLTRPSAGAVSYPGAEKTDAQGIRSRVGLVAHGTLLYDDLTAAENLRFFGALFGLGDLASRTATALASVGLSERADSLVRTFSRGMRQRLSLARAMLHGPGLLLLDEPATGLDQEAREWLDRTLESLHAAGCTVVMSTHADEQGNAATRTVWLSGGAVVRDSADGQSGAGAGATR